MANPSAGHQSLVRLKNGNYEVAPGEPDVRGWDVCLASDQKIGEVDDLIIEPAAGKVRYLDVDLDSDVLNLEKNRHVLIPISVAQLDTNEEEVLLTHMSREVVLKLPDYDAVKLDATYDETFLSHFSDDRGSADELDTAKRTDTADVEREEVDVMPLPGNVLFKE